MSSFWRILWAVATGGYFRRASFSVWSRYWSWPRSSYSTASRWPRTSSTSFKILSRIFNKTNHCWKTLKEKSTEFIWYEHFSNCDRNCCGIVQTQKREQPSLLSPLNGAWFRQIKAILTLYYIHFEITGNTCSLIGSQQCDLFTNHTIFCSESHLF